MEEEDTEEEEDTVVSGCLLFARWSTSFPNSFVVSELELTCFLLPIRTLLIVPSRRVERCLPPATLRSAERFSAGELACFALYRFIL